MTIDIHKVGSSEIILNNESDTPQLESNATADWSQSLDDTLICLEIYPYLLLNDDTLICPEIYPSLPLN